MSAEIILSPDPALQPAQRAWELRMTALPELVSDHACRAARRPPARESRWACGPPKGMKIPAAIAS